MIEKLFIIIIITQIIAIAYSLAHLWMNNRNFHFNAKKWEEADKAAKENQRLFRESRNG